MIRQVSDPRSGRIAMTYGDLNGRGNSYLVPVIPKTDFSMDGRAAGATQEIPLAVGIDSSAWVSGVLSIRVHARNNWTPNPGTLPTMSIVVDNIMLTPDEPDVVFVGSAIATVSTLSTATVGQLLLASFSGAIGPMLRVRMTYSVASGNAQTAVNTIALGIDLIGRPA